MRVRALVLSLTWALLAAPLAAGAQRPGKIPYVGYTFAGAED